MNAMCTMVVARAALQPAREHGMDLTQVSLYPSESLAGSGVKCGHGFYATDGRAARGLPGADPDYEATRRVCDWRCGLRFLSSAWAICPGAGCSTRS